MSVNSWNLSSADIEQDFPYTSRVILRTRWLVHEQLSVNQRLSELCNQHYCHHFNRISCYNFASRDQASRFTDFIRERRLHRLKPDCHVGPTQQELALEWMRICDERQTILAW